MLVGNLAYAGCRWGMLVVLAKLGSPELVGLFALGLALSTPVMLLMNASLRSVLVTDARGTPFSQYLATRLTTAFLSLLVIALVVAALGYSWNVSSVIFAVGAAKSVESISDIFHGLFQKYEQMDRIAKSLLLKGVSSLLAFSLAIHVTRNLLAGLAAILFAWALTLLCYELPTAVALTNTASTVPGTASRHAIRPSVSREAMGRLILLGSPLALASMMTSLNVTLPRLVVERHLGESQLGIFVAISYVSLIGTTLVSSLAQAALPSLTRHFETNRSAFKHLSLKLATLGATLGLAGVLVSVVFGRVVLTVLYSPEYGDYTNLLSWVMVDAAIRYVVWFVGTSITAARSFKPQLALRAGAALITFSSCAILVPRLGLAGAVWSMCAASAVQLVAAWLILDRAMRNNATKIP